VETVLRGFAELAKGVGRVVVVHDLQILDGRHRHAPVEIQAVRVRVIVKHRLSGSHHKAVGRSFRALLEVLPQW